MKFIKLEVTPEELKLLTSLAADQLFRKEFIDPKMPGYRCDHDEISRGKALIQRLRLAGDPGSVAKVPTPTIRKTGNGFAAAASRKP